MLRRLSLDELPQLWNVLRGDMALVGPRTVLRSELGEYGKHTEAYLSMRPGLTGMWQVSGAHHKGYPDRVRLICCIFAGLALDRSVRLGAHAARGFAPHLGPN